MEIIKGIVTTKSIIVHLDDKQYKVYKDSDEERYSQLKMLLAANRAAVVEEDKALIEETVANVRALLAPANNIIRYTEGHFFISDGLLYFKDRESEPVDKVVAEQIIAFHKQQLPYEPLIRFWKKLRDNPSKNSNATWLGGSIFMMLCDDGYFNNTNDHKPLKLY